MRPGFAISKFRWRRAAFYALLAAGVVVVAVAVLTRPGLQTLADPDDLIGKFETVAFGNDYGAEHNFVRRWETGLRVRLSGAAREGFRDRLYLYMGWIELLTGLEAGPVRTVPNVEIYFVPKSEFWAIARRNGWYSSFDRKFIESAACFGKLRKRKSRYYSAIVGIKTDQGRHFAESCLLEEVVQMLGLSADTELLRPSIFSRRDQITELSVNDKLLLRTLYDDRIAPGMGRAEAMRVARRVIAELVEAVKENGEAALIHPRYRARISAN